MYAKKILYRGRWIALLAALAITASYAGTSNGLIPPDSRKSAPDFALQDSSGSTLRLSDYKGKVVLLDFWATWCHGCQQEIPWYVEFQDKYRDSGLVAIGASMDGDEWKSVRPFLASHKINYPIVIASDELGKQYRADSLPLTLLIDQDGKIAAIHSGMVDKNDFEGEIQALLKGAGPHQ